MKCPSCFQAFTGGSAACPHCGLTLRRLRFGLKIALGLLVLLAFAAAFYFALRAWRSSNLFHREYRFPVPKNVALRLGASRSGGRMATADFAANAPGQSSSLRTKDPKKRHFNSKRLLDVAAEMISQFFQPSNSSQDFRGGEAGRNRVRLAG